MNPENQLTADRDAGLVALRDSGRVMAAPAEFFSMLGYAAASFGGEVSAVLREVGEVWGRADAERFGHECADPGNLLVDRFSGACSDRLAGRGFGRTFIREIQDAAVIELSAPPPHSTDLLAGWFAIILTGCVGVPLSCETGDDPFVGLKVVPADQAENADDGYRNGIENSEP